MLMVIFHIVIAVASVLLSALGAIRPQRFLLKLNYVLVVSTLTTGGILIANGASVWHMCVSGITYCAVAIALGEVARRRFVISGADAKTAL